MSPTRRLGCAVLVLSLAIGASVFAAVVFAAPPSNDDFANAQAISGPLPLVVTGTTTEATTEPGEPYFGDETIWYRWTATESREVAIESCGGSSYPPNPRVYTGSSLATLKKVRWRDGLDYRAKCPLPNPSQDDPQDTYDVVEFDAVAGTTYRIQLVHSEPGKVAIVLRPPEVYDLGVKVSVSRRTVPAGGALTEKMKVTNGGNIPVPTRQVPRLVFGQELNRPGQPFYPGKAVYAFVRSPGARCRHGNYAPGSKVQTFACYVTHLDPGEAQTVRIKITGVKSNLLLDAHAPGGDDRKGNDDAPTVVRVRR